MPDLSPEERDLQLQFCREALDELTAPKHRHFNIHILAESVHESLVIVTPKCKTIRGRLSNNKYSGFGDFEYDIRRMIKCGFAYGAFAHNFDKLTEIFDDKWAQRHAWIAARMPSSVSEPVVKEIATSKNIPEADSSKGVAAPKRNGATAGIDPTVPSTVTDASPTTNLLGSKKSRAAVQATPLPKPLYSKSDKVFVKNIHKSIAGYLFTVERSVFSKDRWNYALLNEEVMGSGQAWFFAEGNIVKPPYDMGATLHLRAGIGKTIRGVVKAVRMVDGKLEYEAEMVAEPQTYTAEEMAELFKAPA